LIHPTAIVHPGAQLAEDVEVGPYSIIGPEVEIGAGTWIGPHALVNGPTRIGRDNRIFQFASVGEAPQDKSFRGEPTRLEIGDRNLIREYCTLNRGTVKGGGVTRIGDDNWFMAYTHVAHDCIVGSNAIFANAASLGGHVEVGDWVMMGGFAIVHQFTKIGAHSMCGLGAVLKQDLPPYVMADGYPARPHGINKVGLRRRGFSDEAIKVIVQAYKLIYRKKLKLGQALEEVEALAAEQPEVRALADFVGASERGIIR
jgi:UDP-N-acetylglucosamine acyltransferase